MTDANFMYRAFMLAKKGVGFTSPNPAVGAVIVKNGKIIGEGYHRKAGGPHAELEAVKSLKSKVKSLRGATLYVTLEPCCHYGKTPPCTDAIIAAGITHVVVGMKDPFHKVSGRGIAVLKRAGVRVSALNAKSPLVKDIKALNQPFLKWATTGLPYVILKAGISLDGKIATRTGESKWITGEAARKDARLERSLCDAVLVGAGTVVADDPELAPHGKYKNKKLLRIIIDPELKLPLNKKIFRDENVLVACTNRAAKKDVDKFIKNKIKIKSFGQDRVSIVKLLKYLGELGIQSVFVEGGSTTHGAFYDEAVRMTQNTNNKAQIIVDKVIFYIAPKIIGGSESISAVGGEGVKKLDKAVPIKNIQTEQLENDIKVSGVYYFY